jgi:hypothetical protein
VQLENQALKKLDEHLPPCGGGWEGGEAKQDATVHKRSLNTVHPGLEPGPIFVAPNQP